MRFVEKSGVRLDNALRIGGRNARSTMATRMRETMKPNKRYKWASDFESSGDCQYMGIKTSDSSNPNAPV